MTSFNAIITQNMLYNTLYVSVWDHKLGSLKFYVIPDAFVKSPKIVSFRAKHVLDLIGGEKSFLC